MRQTITIATSLAPGKDIRIQREAVNSWCRLGFTVVSVNCIEEIAKLKSSFPEIEFIEAFSDARRQFGKPYIYFDDIIACLWERDSDICGIVNSDIHFLEQGLYPFLLEEGAGSFIYGSRMDVEALNQVKGRIIHDGFDYFFFDRKVIATYPPSRFCIGMPCWDYWAVLSPLFWGISIKKVVTSHAYHIRHTVNWSDGISNMLFRSELLRHIKPLSAGAASAYYMLAFMDRYSFKISLGNDEYDRKQLKYMRPHIKKVITRGDIQGEIIDELLFLRRK